MFTICYNLIFKSQRRSCVFNAVFDKDAILVSLDKKKESLINFANALNLLLAEHNYYLETDLVLLYSNKDGFVGALEDRRDSISILENEYSGMELHTSPVEDRG